MTLVPEIHDATRRIAGLFDVLALVPAVRSQDLADDLEMAYILEWIPKTLEAAAEAELRTMLARR